MYSVIFLWIKFNLESVHLKGLDLDHLYIFLLIIKT